MISLHLNIEATTLDRVGQRLDEAMKRHVHAGIGDALNVFRGKLIEERMRGQGVQTRTAALQRSFGIVFPDPLTGVLITDSKYYRVQEYGGTIRSNRAGGFLAIPLPAAKTPAGVSRYPSPLRQSLKIAFPQGTFVRKSKGGNLILFGVKGKASKLIPLFLLREQVVLTPKLGLRALWAQFRVKQLPDLMGGYVLRALAEAAKAGGK